MRDGFKLFYEDRKIPSWVFPVVIFSAVTLTVLNQCLEEDESSSAALTSLTTINETLCEDKNLADYTDDAINYVIDELVDADIIEEPAFEEHMSDNNLDICPS